MPAGDAAFEGPALAVLDGDEIASVVCGRRHDHQRLAIEGPLFSGKVERGFVDRVEPGLMLAGLLAGFLERQGHGLTVDGLCYGCVCHGD